jgi:peptide/nickel transport system permease protein
MRRFAITRLLLIPPTLLFLLTLIFVAMRVVPGDPIDAMIGLNVPQAYHDELYRSFGFDKPIYVQYASFLWDVLHLQMGISYVTHRSIIVDITERFPLTLELSLLSMVFAVVIGVVGGVVSATHVGQKSDRIIGVVSYFAFSLPLFWAALVMQLVLSVWWRILPVAGTCDWWISCTRVTGAPLLDAFLTGNIVAIVNVARHYVLPVICMGYFSAITIERISRTEMVRALHEGYIMTARAKGLKENVVIYKHALRNALLPTITIIGLLFAGVLGGAVITETVFALPGLGRLTIDSILQRDFPAVQGVVVFYALIVTLAGFIIDLAYGLIDPRVRY